MHNTDRRNFLKISATFLSATATGTAVAAPRKTAAVWGAEHWNAGDLVHLLPLVNHRRLRIKASFREPRAEPPKLRVDARTVVGTRSDTRGRFWCFDLDGLAAARTYELQLTESGGKPICDAWPLRTFPAPHAAVEHLRILVYTCGGGNGKAKLPIGTPFFLPIEVRQRLLDRALSLPVDVAIGIGDQVYWDLETGLNHPRLGRFVRAFYDRYGRFDFDLPVLGSANEDVFTRVVDDQLSTLYGVRFRSLPTYLTQDDHDYFENDVATDRIVTFPPTPYMRRLARATQRLYFPEFLPDEHLPGALPGVSSVDPTGGISQSFGTLRYGRLVEALMYDCRGYLSLKGPTAGFVSRGVERWLARRTADEPDVRHLLHLPSTPFGWSAGKWGEWYPDRLEADRSFGTKTAKPYWQSGWFAQHQRLLKAIGGQEKRIPLIVSGDLHAVGSGRITRSGDWHSGAGVTSVLAGPLGTAGPGWPSAFRGTPPQVPSALEVQPSLSPVEKNGFTLIDITPKSVTLSQFAWRPPEPVEKIDSLKPINVVRLARPG